MVNLTGGEGGGVVALIKQAQLCILWQYLKSNVQNAVELKSMVNASV
jgi:hypothetical protein